MASRKLVLQRRENAVNDLSKANANEGDIAHDDITFCRSLGKNNISAIGLGTESETGLDPIRYPVRVILNNGSGEDTSPIVVVKGWVVKDGANNTIRFRRQAPVNDTVLRHLLVTYTNFDTMMANAVRTSNGHTCTVNTELGPTMETLYTLMKNTTLSIEQVQTMNTTIDTLLADAATRRVKFQIKIGDNAYLFADRHACELRATGEFTGIKKLAAEFALTFRVNHKMFSSRFPTVSSGLVTYCAYAVAWYFREGLFESFESNEYNTLVVEKVADTNTNYKVTKVVWASGATVPPEYEVGQVIDIAGTKYSKTMITCAPAGVYCAGLNHYTYNHTTVGNRLGGPMLSLLKTNSLYDNTKGDDEEIRQTNLVYEAFHPVNKRAIANIFFESCQVYTYGKPAGTYSLQPIELDQFLKIRQKPTPAGAHKAYICGAVLQMVLRQNLGVFLSFAGSLAFVIDSISRVVEVGARAHIGSSYYTGYPAITQGTQLDEYMPDLAQFMQIIAPRHTLCLSPHLSPEVAARASVSFTNIIKKVRGKEFSSLKDEVIEDYLNRSGSLSFTFNPEDRNTWTNSITENQNFAARLADVMNI